MIGGEILPYNKMAKEMMKLKRANNKKYAKELQNDFATYAYKECYKKTRKSKGSIKSKTRKRNN